eukprot:6206906-Pleurochrysis_carterae.AAC.2
MAFQDTKAIAVGARRTICDYLLTTYAALAVVVMPASQPATYACAVNFWRRMISGMRSIGNSLARAAKMRRTLPQGLATCGILFILVAFISRGDAALVDLVVRVRGAIEAQVIYTSVMLSAPTTAPAGARSMWLGYTGAGMHSVTDISLAVEGSVRAKSTLIVTANGTTRPKYR